MAQTIGQLLQKEREQRGLTIADVAHDTRIHANTIRGLEADDYSVFSSTTYAKSFLQLYSRHLEIDANETLHEFDSVTEGLNSGNFSYLKSVTSAIEPGETIHPHESISHTPSYGEARRQPFPLFLALIVFLLLLIIPVFYLVGKKAESMEEAKSIFKDALTNRGNTGNEPQTSLKHLASPNAPTTSSNLDRAVNNQRKSSSPAPLPELNSAKPASSAPPLKAVPVVPDKPAPNTTATAQI
ncbi:MAG: hypothetical protein GXP30_07770 [Verrucomicrobia bacterium]|nr:hypothetical protein [Verrucomicrobiota bacterium]